MNEKKHFLLLALAAVVCLAFFPACSDGSESGSVVGTWATQETDPMVLHLNSDGTFDFEDSDSGTYEVSGSTVTLTSEWGDIIVLTLSGNTLKGVSYTEEGGTEEPYPLTFTRQ